MPNSYYCELKDIADAFEKLLDVEYIYTLKSKSSETGIKELYIRFVREHLYHLSGLQHFEDVVKLKLFNESHLLKIIIIKKVFLKNYN